MTFAVDDFEDFLAILGAHPEWQAKLRRILVDDELAELRRTMEAGFARLAERIDALAEATAAQLEVTNRRIGTLEVDMGKVKGIANEGWYRDRAAGIFGHVLRRVRPISFADLDAVRNAHRAGTVTPDEWKDVRSLALLVQGIDDDDRVQTIALEVAWTLDEGDVIRVARRARAIERSGVRCTPAAAGHEGHDGIFLAARTAGVAVLREGDIVYWPEGV